jgi:hypothetical protein
MTDSTNVVTVYVRLCDNDRDDCRELGFRIPDGIEQADLLNAGFAIDGHTAVKSALAYKDGNEYVPLSQSLRQVQMHLAGWLNERGYQVQFN